MPAGPHAPAALLAVHDQELIDLMRQQVLTGTTGRNERGRLARFGQRIVLQVIEDELHHHRCRYRSAERMSVAQRIPRTPVQQSGLIGSAGVRRLPLEMERLRSAPSVQSVSSVMV